jgi:hypothetical protein
MTPAELFTSVGRALYGQEFTAPLAAKLHVPRNTLPVIPSAPIAAH